MTICVHSAGTEAEYLGQEAICAECGADIVWAGRRWEWIHAIDSRKITRWRRLNRAGARLSVPHRG